MIHTANPVEHANHMAAQPQFVHPEHRSFVDLSGHNLANPHPFAGGNGGKRVVQNAVACRVQMDGDTHTNLVGSVAHNHCLSATQHVYTVTYTRKLTTATEQQASEAGLSASSWCLGGQGKHSDKFCLT